MENSKKWKIRPFLLSRREYLTKKRQVIVKNMLVKYSLRDEKLLLVLDEILQSIFLE